MIKDNFLCGTSGRNQSTAAATNLDEERLAKAMNLVSSSPVRGSRRFVLVTMIVKANEKVEYEAGLGPLTAYCGASRRRLLKIAKELQAAGEIEIVRPAEKRHELPAYRFPRYAEQPTTRGEKGGALA